MQSTAIIQQQEAMRYPLALNEKDHETLEAIYGELGTITLNNTTLPSPRYTKLKAELKEQTAESLQLLDLLIQTKKMQLQRAELKNAAIVLPEREYVLLATLIAHITKLQIKFGGNLAQLIETMLDTTAVVHVFMGLIIPMIAKHRETLIEINRTLYLKHIGDAQAEHLKAKKISDDIALYLETIIVIHNTHSSKLNDHDNDFLLMLVSDSYDINEVLDMIKSMLNNKRIRAPLTRKCSTFQFLDLLKENPRVKQNPSIEIKMLYCEYLHLFHTSKNSKAIEKHYNEAKASILLHHTNSKITDQKYRYFLHNLEVAHVGHIGDQLIKSIPNHDKEAAHDHLSVIITLMSSINQLNFSGDEATKIQHEHFNQVIHGALGYASFLCLGITASNIAFILDEIKCVRTLVDLYRQAPKSEMHWEHFFSGFQQTFQPIEAFALARKEKIEAANSLAEELASTLEERTRQYNAEFEHILQALDDELKKKIKQKPKTRRRQHFTLPLASTTPPAAEQATEANTPIDTSPSLAERSRDYFSANAPENYGPFVDEQTPENKAEALLYVGDYFMHAKKIDRAIEQFEAAYTLAMQATPPHPELIDNLKLSLDITYEYLDNKLAQNILKMARFDESRYQHIMHLGYIHEANVAPDSDAKTPQKNLADYEKYIYNLGLTDFRNIGKAKTANQQPLSHYAAERNALAREKKRLLKHCQSTKQLLDKIEGKPSNALTQNSLFKPTNQHPAAKPKPKQTKAKRRQNKRK